MTNTTRAGQSEVSRRSLLKRAGGTALALMLPASAFKAPLRRHEAQISPRAVHQRHPYIAVSNPDRACPGSWYITGQREDGFTLEFRGDMAQLADGNSHTLHYIAISPLAP